MSRYRHDPDAIRRLVQPDQVHRDVYLDQELFELEMERLWARTWVYVGHDSQVPNPGDYITTDIATRPMIMVRHDDGSVRVLHNRCAHKGAKLLSAPAGNTGRFLRCPYHAWSYTTDGALLARARGPGARWCSCTRASSSRRARARCA
jgi:phenylpropionate dioxygenase-like ring-hydroxylating dioxygenase large terminal subunit